MQWPRHQQRHQKQRHQRHQKQRHQHRQGRRPDPRLGPGYRTGSRSIAHTHTRTHALYTCLTQAKVAQCSPNPGPALAAAREQNLHSDGKGGDLPSYQSYPLTTANRAEFASQRQRRDGLGSRGSGGCRGANGSGSGSESGSGSRGGCQGIPSDSPTASSDSE